jgi:thiol:disulfide interchange protein
MANILEANAMSRKRFSTFLGRFQPPSVIPLLLVLVFNMAGLGHAQNIATALDTNDTPVITTQLAVGPTSNGQTALAWEFQMAPGWHIYWQNAGDSGLPPELTLSTSGTITPPLTLRFPAPEAIDLPGVTTYGFHARAVLLTEVTSTNSSQPVIFQARFLYCKDICLPGSATYQLPNLQPTPQYAALADHHSAHLPQTLPTGFNLTRTTEGLTLTLPTDLQGATSARFIPATEGMIADNTPQTLRNGHLIITEDPQAPISATSLAGVLRVNDQAYTFPRTALPTTLTPIAAQPSASLGLTFWAAIGFALLAGVILNLMPCVLPVLGLKVLALVKHHGVRARRQQTVAYTLGILTMFWAFAGAIALLQQSGAQFGWGFHLQNPVFVGILAALMVVLALNFFGVFTVGETLTQLGHAPTQPSSHHNQRQQLLQSFGTGVLAVVVATPCTVPFMGGAMAYALSQTLWQSLAVFTALGLGLALPFMVLASVPSLLKWLPKPGRWMLTLKHAMGWPMLLTAVWLLWVLTNQTSSLLSFGFMAGLVLLAALLQWWGTHSNVWRTLIVIAYLVSLIVALSASMNRAPSPTHAVSWQPWSITAVAAGQAAQRPVLVDFTADWCLTCKVTEATVLNTAAAQQLFADKNVLLLRGDWTKQDPAITAELARHGRRGVPLYLLYQPGSPTPIILPQLPTLNDFRTALSS